MEGRGREAGGGGGGGGSGDGRSFTCSPSQLIVIVSVLANTKGTQMVSIDDNCEH